MEVLERCWKKLRGDGGLHERPLHEALYWNFRRQVG